MTIWYKIMKDWRGMEKKGSRGKIKRNEKKKRPLALYYFSTVRSTEQRQDGNSSI
jgi:hypothetical protein